jgi:peptidoglycan/xylan/chitin deacetylase (PgdA/CDA1 family)
LAEPRGSEDMETTRPLARDELTRLGDDGLIEIGAHTVSHPVLSRLAHPQQREEVVLSKETLEEALGRPIASFAYPYGAHEDFDDVTVDVVREAGFHRACTTLSGRLGGGTDPYRLPRFLVRDWTADELERRLSVV